MANPKKKHGAITLAIALGLFAVITPWKTNKTAHLPTVSTLSAETTFLNDDTIHVMAKAYTSEESKKYLKKDLLKYGIQPVQITIQNNSREEFSLSNGSVDLPTAEPSSIAKKVMISALPRGIILRVASIFFWPVMIPSTIDSVITIKSYKIIKNDLTAKSVKKEVIAPYSIYNRIVFVPMKEYKESFDINLIEIPSLKTKVIHVSGLEKGMAVEATSSIESQSPDTTGSQEISS